MYTRAICGNCPYWGIGPSSRNDPRPFGECRRYPPVPRRDLSNTAEEQFTDVWPIMTSEMWCGEHPYFIIPQAPEG
jgi:hypothetical protein